MAFLQRVIGYLVNEFIVTGLANSKIFQQFAVRSSSAYKEATKKGVENKAKYVEQLEDVGKKFQAELRKGMDLFGNGQQPRR